MAQVRPFRYVILRIILVKLRSFSTTVQERLVSRNASVSEWTVAPCMGKVMDDFFHQWFYSPYCSIQVHSSGKSRLRESYRKKFVERVESLCRRTFGHTKTREHGRKMLELICQRRSLHCTRWSQSLYSLYSQSHCESQTVDRICSLLFHSSWPFGEKGNSVILVRTVDVL